MQISRPSGRLFYLHRLNKAPVTHPTYSAVGKTKRYS